MATSPFNKNRLADGGFFFTSVNSYLHPSFLNKNTLSWGINVDLDGGIPRTRLGYKLIQRLADGKAQGLTIFTPVDQQPFLVAAVSGIIYVSRFPFDTYQVLPNIQFDPFVDHIAFKEAIVGVDNAGNPINPYPVLMMQDGLSKPAYWDGSTSRHLNPGGTTNETPFGLWMEWVGARLWVSRGNQIFASNIYNPLLFTETQYLTGGGALQTIDGNIVTAMKRTADNKALLIFSRTNTTIVKAGITDRSTWQTTADFIGIKFPGVGATGGKSVFDNDGDVWWMSDQGMRNFAQVGSAVETSRNSISSVEMARSFDNLSPVLNRCAGFSVGKYLGMSVPSGDVYNRHTWVINTAISDQLSSDSPPSWTGIYMGTRPVEWATGNINGRDRCFHISQDRCGVRIWEAFQKDRNDNGCRIFSQVDFNGIAFESPLAFKSFLFTEYHLSYVAGNVSLEAFYKGDWGCWKSIMDIDLCAQNCMSATGCPIPKEMIPQNRYIKTQQAGTNCQSEEGAFSGNIGTYFQNRTRWYGECGVRMYKSQANQFQENSLAQCAESDATCKVLSCCESEVDYAICVDDGYGYGSSNNLCFSL